MSKAKFYSTNVTGQQLVIKATSMRQVAEYFDEPLHRVAPYTSICGSSVKRADVDLTENQQKGHQMKVVSTAMKTAGFLAIVGWSVHDHISPVSWLGLGVLLLLFSWYVLDFYHFREKQHMDGT